MDNAVPAADVFISYSRKDAEVVARLCTELGLRGLTYFIDKERIEWGDEWKRSLAIAIKGCRYFALVHSSNANVSGNVKTEVSFAKADGRRGWIKLDTSEPDITFDFVFSQFHTVTVGAADRDEKIREFAQLIYETLKPRSNTGRAGSLDPERSPYQGLSPFDGSQATRLYGRDAEIGVLCNDILRSVADTERRSQGANRRLFFVYGPSGTGKSSLVSAGVIPALKEKFHTVGPCRLMQLGKSFLEYAREAGDKPCVISVDQFEEIWADSEKVIPEHLSDKLHNNGILAALKTYPKLVILLHFREEYLAKMEELCQPMSDYLKRHVVRGLTKDAAADCIRGPALAEDIEYDDDLVKALVNRLATEENQIGEDGSRPFYVEPVELQIVCSRLWRELPAGTPKIHARDLRQACLRLLPDCTGNESLDQLASMFVTYATHGFLDSAVQVVSKTQAARDCNYDDPDRIYFALLQFVTDSNKRDFLKVHKEAGSEWVGRLPIRIVNELTNNRLLRAVNISGTLGFELVHDRLAVPISEKKERLGLLYAVNSLDSAMTKVRSEQKDKNLQGWFQDYEPLIKDLTEFKSFEGLNADEAEFVFRSALVTSKDASDDLMDWTRTIAEQHPGKLASVLHDAFSIGPGNGRVRMNAAYLLRDQWLQSKLGSNGLMHILAALEQASRGSASDGELEQFCHTLAVCPSWDPGGATCDHLDRLVPVDSAENQISSRSLLWMRDKADMATQSCFVRRWNRIPAGRRGFLMLQLFGLRFRQSFVRMSFIVLISAIVTGIGAAIMYAFWGVTGSSFTQATAANGFGQGLFHGFFGGITWGIALSLSTLLYWLVLRGRRIQNSFSHWLGGVLLSSIAGLLGGLALARMILSVDEAHSLLAAGWLLSADDKSFIAASVTGASWIFPIYGLFLGFGVGWSMLSVYHDHKFRKFVRSVKPLKSAADLRAWAARIALRVLMKSLPIAITMAMAGIVTTYLFAGHNLDTYPCQWGSKASPTQAHQGETPAPCGVKRIAPLAWRATGTSVIIYTGACSLMFGYLLALLTIRFGVEVPEDKSFLGGI